MNQTHEVFCKQMAKVIHVFMVGGTTVIILVRGPLGYYLLLYYWNQNCVLRNNMMIEVLKLVCHCVLQNIY